MTNSLPQRAHLYEDALVDNPVKPRTIYYHAFRTCIMSCSPFAIFQELAADASFSDYEHIWVYSTEASLEYDTFKRYRDTPNVRFVEAGSKEQAEALATCEYFITNAGLPSYWRKRKGQTVINTWHGTPLKSLGKDARDYMGSAIGNAQRNFLLSDYLVMPNRYTAERILESYCLDGMFHGKILDVGSPRVDAVVNSDKARTRSLLEKKYGSSIDGKKIVLYAPTFRSVSGKSLNTTAEMAGYMQGLVDRTPEDYIVFFKVHNTLGRFFAGNVIMSNRLIFDEIETNELLAVTDVLITDYSSIFFDFICTQRPVLFFVYDKEAYSLEHGMYLEISDMPGTECATLDDVITCIDSIAEGRYKNPNQAYGLETFAYNDDGGATKRAVDIMFRNRSAAEGALDDRSETDSTTGLTDILVSLENEPFLSSVLMLSEVLRAFDPKRHRVTIAAHDVHLIWKECARTFPSAQIVFADIETSVELSNAPRNDAFFHDQYKSFFRDMSFDEYYNLKSSEGIIDEMVSKVFPGIPKHWRFCWSERLSPSRIARASQDYESTVMYASHLVELPRKVLEAPMQIVTDTDLRAVPEHEMGVLLIANFDSTNYTLAACARELSKRGHRVFVSLNNTNSLVNARMFSDEDYDIVALKHVDYAALTFLDMAVGAPLKSNSQRRLYRHIITHNLLLFSFCNLFSSVAMRISPDFVFTLGETKNDELRTYNLHYNCVAIGNPQYDNLIGLRKGKSDKIRRVLVIEQGGYPYGEKGKRQLAGMLLRAAELNPEIEFVVKPRYLPKSSGKGSIHTVSEHIYDFLGERPGNLVLMTEHSTIEDIISDYDAMLTMWSTAFLDAMMMDMPLLLAGGFDSVDVFDVRTQRIAEAYERLEGTGCLKRYDEIGKNIADDFSLVDAAFAEREVYDYRNPATERAVRFLELAYETLVKPNLRIGSEFSGTEQDYYERFSELELVDADSPQYIASRKYRNALNAKLQEYVFLNRCMGAVLDLSELEEFYQVTPPPIDGDELADYILEKKLELRDAFYDAERRYFESDEGASRVETDRILQDFYFEWLYRTEQWGLLENPSITHLLAPESLEYYLARIALDRLQLRRAYDHLFMFLKMSKERPVVQLLKCKRIHESMRPFKRGPLQLLFFATLMKPENEEVIEVVYKEPERMPIVALQRARALNELGKYEECVAFCDKALLHRPRKKRGRNVFAAGRIYAKKAFYRVIDYERERAFENANARANEQAGDAEGQAR